MIVEVIGGVGVAATNKLLERIVVRKALNGTFRDLHHIEMIVCEVPKLHKAECFLSGKGRFIEE